MAVFNDSTIWPRDNDLITGECSAADLTLHIHHVLHTPYKINEVRVYSIILISTMIR